MSDVPLPKKIEDEILQQKKRTNTSSSFNETRPKHKVTISGSAAPTEGSLPLVRSNPFRVISAIQLKDFFITLQNPVSKQFIIEFFVDGVSVAKNFIPANAKETRSRISSDSIWGLVVPPNKLFSIQILNIDPNECGNIGLSIAGFSFQKYTKDIFLFFAEPPKESIGIVYDSFTQPDGKIVVAGDFETCAQTRRKNIARLNSDGTLDEGFDAGVGPDRAIGKIRLDSDNKIYAAGVSRGPFFNWNNVSSPNFVRLNSDGSIDNTWVVNPVDVGETVYDYELVDSGGIMGLGGGNIYGGSQRIFRLDNTGAKYTLSYPASVFSVYASQIRKKLNGKFFITRWGTPYSRIWNMTDEVDHEQIATGDWRFADDNGATVGKLDVFVDGPFYRYFMPLRYISIQAGLFGSYDFLGGILRIIETSDSLISVEVYDDYIFSDTYVVKVLSDDNLLAGGAVMKKTEGETPLGNLIKINQGGELDEEFVENFQNLLSPSGIVYTLEEQTDGKIIVGGNFEVKPERGKPKRKNLIRVNADGSLDESFPVV